jgi:parallel beta-helix repeat protein
MTMRIGRTNRGAALAGLLALAGAAAAYPAAAGPFVAIPISSCPYTILAAGNYALTQDLTCPGTEPAITVAPGVDNVRLFLKGRTLTGDGQVGGIVAEGTPEDPIEGLRIVGGTVTGFSDGVLIRNAPGARVARLTADGNLENGIYVDQSPNARIVGNTASGSVKGIYVRDCEGCWIVDNRATGNARSVTSDGIWLLGSTSAWVKRNTATGNGDDGIELVSNSTNNLIRANVTTGNNGSGIDVADGSRGNRLVRNRATGNDANNDGTEQDLTDRNLSSGCVNTWLDNSFATDSEDDGPGAGCIR